MGQWWSELATIGRGVSQRQVERDPDGVISGLHLGIDRILKVAETGCGPFPYITFVRDGRIADHELEQETRRYERRWRRGAASRLWAEGFGIRIYAADLFDRGVHEVTRRAEQTVGEPIVPVVFASPPGSPTLPKHKDTSHVAVIQMEGEKSWVVESPGLGEFVLNPGERFAMAHGTAHHALATSTVSVHLSLTWGDTEQVRSRP